VDGAAGTSSLAAQPSYEAAWRFAPDRFPIAALKGPVADLFQIETVAHGQDAIDQRSVLTVAVGGLAALDVGNAGLGLLHPAGFFGGSGSLDGGPVRPVAVRVVGPALAVEAALQAAQGGPILFDLRAKWLQESRLRSNNGKGRGTEVQADPTDAELMFLFAVGLALVDQLDHEAVVTFVFAPHDPGKLDRAGQAVSDDRVVGRDDCL
jgi:hypothetical protein